MSTITLAYITERRKALAQRKWERLLFSFSFFMSFPSVLVFGQNISVFIFCWMVLFLLQYSKSPLLTLRKPLQWLALCFGVGAILSVINIPEVAASDSLERALAVLPNYLYWCTLIILLVTHRQLINIKVVYKAIFWGLVSSVIYYLFFQGTLSVLPIFNKQSPNTLSFILICYTPIALYYLQEQKGKTWAFLFLLTLVYILLIDGRRAGMVLVLLGGLAVLYADRLNWKRLIVTAVIVPIGIAGIYTSPVEGFMLQSSERIHEMIYQTDKIRTEDRSYLTRVAMVKKGLAIFEDNPYTGIGLNNFTNFSIDFDHSFEGAKYVIHKENLQTKSAHNSYIGILAEGGLMLLMPLLLILGSLILYFLLNFNLINRFERPVYVGILAMSVHLYFISDIVNVFAWFLIGLCCALVYTKY